MQIICVEMSVGTGRLLGISEDLFVDQHKVKHESD